MEGGYISSSALLHDVLQEVQILTRPRRALEIGRQVALPSSPRQQEQETCLDGCLVMDKERQDGETPSHKELEERVPRLVVEVAVGKRKRLQSPREWPLDLAHDLVP